MTDQIPHLTMGIIARRATNNLNRTEETAEQHYLGAPVPDYRAAVDAVLAARDREVAAKALREAAADLRDHAVHEEGETEHNRLITQILLGVVSTLNDRADRIGAGDE